MDNTPETNDSPVITEQSSNDAEEGTSSLVDNRNNPESCMKQIWNKDLTNKYLKISVWFVASLFGSAGPVLYTIVDNLLVAGTTETSVIYLVKGLAAASLRGSAIIGYYLKVTKEFKFQWKHSICAVIQFVVQFGLCVLVGMLASFIGDKVAYSDIGSIRTESPSVSVYYSESDIIRGTGEKKAQDEEETKKNLSKFLAISALCGCIESVLWGVSFLVVDPLVAYVFRIAECFGLKCLAVIVT